MLISLREKTLSTVITSLCLSIKKERLKGRISSSTLNALFDIQNEVQQSTLSSYKKKLLLQRIESSTDGK